MAASGSWIRVRPSRSEALPNPVANFSNFPGFEGCLAKANDEYRPLVVESHRSRR